MELAYHLASKQSLQAVPQNNYKHLYLLDTQ